MTLETLFPGRNKILSVNGIIEIGSIEIDGFFFYFIIFFIAGFLQTWPHWNLSSIVWLFILGLDLLKL